jgi:aminopeptidase N
VQVLAQPQIKPVDLTAIVGRRSQSMNSLPRRPGIDSLLIAAVALLGTLLSPVASADTDLPDRSLLWRWEEALDRVVPPQLLQEWQQAWWPLLDDYGYDVDDYDLEIDIDLSTQLIDAAATMTVTVSAAGQTEFAIDLDDDLTVTRVMVDGFDRAYAQTPDQLLVTLPVSPPPGTQLAIRIEYGGRPAEVGNKSMRFRSHGGVPLVYTLSTPYSTASTTVIPISHYWRPCKDVPDDKSTFSAAITVPDTMLACSNGLLTSNVLNGNGTRTMTWEHDYPVAPYLIALAATNYVTLDTTYVGPGGTAAIQHFVWPEHVVQATESFNITVPAMEFFATVFGEYPFIGEKYGMFETPPGPAVEEQTVVAYPSVLINGGHTYDWILVHELAHMWWGDCVTCASWEHVWLNEGFASYSEALWWEHLYGPAGLRSYMIGMDSGPYAGTVYDPPYIWHAIVYDKGAWIVHMLRRILGEAAFFQLLLDYRAAYEFDNVTTEEFIAVAETAYGGDLSWYFEPWLYHEGRPDYEYWWHAQGGPAPQPYTVHLAVEQVQSASQPVYTMPIDVRIITTSGSETYTVWDSLRTQTFELPVANEPFIVVLDPDAWVLADFTQVTTGLAESPGAPATYLAQNRPNPFNPHTTIEFGLGRAGTVALRIFDVQGRMVRSLVRGELPAGEHSVTWDGTNDAGVALPSGLYFYRLVGPAGVREQRMVLLR